ncbi:MAG: hypothetical protein K9N51_13185 [Candidatus Pacebacteria bacterium]|nr:hypothetical protein [Candidatus Paceibacterota bacterium]
MTGVPTSLRLVLIPLVIVSCVAHAEKTIYRRLGLTVVGPPGTQENIREVIEKCQRTIAKHFGPRQGTAPPPMLTVYTDASREETTGGQAALALTNSTDPTAAVHRVARKLLSRRAVEMGVSAPDEGQLDGLAAGITYAVARDGPTTPPGHTLDHQAVRNVLRQGTRPDPRQLLRHPVPSHRKSAYTLYAMYCHLLLEILSENTRTDKESPASDLLRQLAAGKDPAGSLEAVVSRYFGPDRPLRPWFAEYALKHATRSPGQFSAEQVVDRLKHILTIEIVQPDEHGRVGIQHAGIHEIGDVLTDYPLNPDMLLRKEKQLIQLIRHAPTPLKPALEQYRMVLRRLLKTNDGPIAKHIERANRMFTEGLANQKRIEAYVNSIERKVVPPEVRFAPYMDVIGDDQERRRRLGPELNDFLDSFAP